MGEINERHESASLLQYCDKTREKGETTSTARGLKMGDHYEVREGH